MSIETEKKAKGTMLICLFEEFKRAKLAGDWEQARSYAAELRRRSKSTYKDPSYPDLARRGYKQALRELE